MYRLMLKSDLLFYCTEKLRGPEDCGGKFLVGSHHLEWNDAVATHDRVLIMSSRDHGKSHMLNMGYALWQADVKHPGEVGYIFSASEPQAVEHLEKIMYEIEGGGGDHPNEPNPALQHLRPVRFRATSGRPRLQLGNGSEIRARGFGSRVRGQHPRWAVADDIGNDEWIWSDTVRSKDVDYFLSAIDPMIVPGGQLLVVGTPFHAADLYAHLKNTGEFKVIESPAETNGVPLWPARYSIAALQRKKRLYGSLRYAREYLVRPISGEASIFPPELFEIKGVKAPYVLGLPVEYWRERGMTLVMGVDLAISSSVGADWFVAIVLAVASNGDRWLVDIVRKKGLGYQEQVSTIIGLGKRYDVGLIFCEANQYQRVISDMIVRESDVPIKAFYTTGNAKKSITNQRRGMKAHYAANKNAIDQGVPALRILLENAKLHFPWALETREAVELLIGELQSYGWAQSRIQSVGAHDDMAMALWIADRAAAVGSAFKFQFADQPADDEVDDAGNPITEENEIDFFGSRPLEDEEEREAVAGPSIW